MTHRLLLVEQSTTMRNVMEKHLASLGFAVDACQSYPQAAQSLDHQFQQFGEDYSGVVFGWPTEPQEDAAAFAGQLDSNNHKDLPVVVMCSDSRTAARAWIAGRDNAVLLQWKEYQGIETRLHELLDLPARLSQDAEPVKPVDNSDIHLLVVDDSMTIRYSMRDLFSQHGYSVTLAATHDEALRMAEVSRFDIAVLDYYLKESTGDELCRDLLSSQHTGDIVCTILTGTYSDHIIKRSLRAGAVECMFKNEASELLLSRINSISQVVRQKRQLKLERQLLEDVLESLAGAVVLVNRERQIVYVNTSALQTLGVAEKSDLIGRPAGSMLEANGPGESGKAVHAATWTLPDGREVDIDYQHALIESSGFSLLRFEERYVPIADAQQVTAMQSGSPAEGPVALAISELSLPVETEAFLMQMQSYLDSARAAQAGDGDAATGMHVSLLLVDVFIRYEEDAELIPVYNDESMSINVYDSLKGITARAHHVVAFSENRYAFLLRHAEETQAYVLTRRVMQRCLEAAPADGSLSSTDSGLACTGSLLSLTRNAAQPLHVLIKHAFNGLDIVNTREPDQAILLDVRRLLKAYPGSQRPAATLPDSRHRRQV